MNLFKTMPLWIHLLIRAWAVENYPSRLIYTTGIWDIPCSVKKGKKIKSKSKYRWATVNSGLLREPRKRCPNSFRGLEIHERDFIFVLFCKKSWFVWFGRSPNESAPLPRSFIPTMNWSAAGKSWNLALD